MFAKILDRIHALLRTPLHVPLYNKTSLKGPNIQKQVNRIQDIKFLSSSLEIRLYNSIKKGIFNTVQYK